MLALGSQRLAKFIKKRSVGGISCTAAAKETDAELGCGSFSNNSGIVVRSVEPAHLEHGTKLTSAQIHSKKSRHEGGNLWMKSHKQNADSVVALCFDTQQTVSPGVGDFVWTLFQDLEHLHLVHTHAADSETAKTSLLAVIIKL